MLADIAAPSPASERPVNPLRLVGAAVLVATAFYMVAGPALDLVRLDPVVQSEAVGCTFEDEIRCPVVEARAVLESVGLLDEASGLWQPALVVTRDVPALAIALLALVLAAPWRLSGSARMFLASAIALVMLVLFVPQTIYGDTLDAVALITD